MTAIRRLLPPVALALLLAQPAAAAEDCGDPGAAAAIAASWQARQPLTGIAPPADLAAATCLRDELVRTLSREAGLGQRAGYKVGLTSRAMQERLGLAEPIWGFLLTGMLLPDGARVPVAFGARPIVEADLVVTVASEAINRAETLEDVVRNLADLRPFLELADLVVREDQVLDAGLVTAINVGARLGVLGEAVPMTPELAAALPGITVTLEGPDLVLQAKGDALLGHPLNAVLWLVRKLREEGRGLRAGEIVSLGSFGPPVPPEPGLFTVRYEGLPSGPLSVRALFEP